MKPFAAWLLVGMLVSIPSTAFSAPQNVTALDEFQSLGARMRQAYTSRAWQLYRSDAIELVRLLNGSPDALLELARASARISDRQAALEELQVIAGMGVSKDAIKTLTDFAPLRQSAEFQRSVAQMASNARPVRHAVQAFIIPDAGLLPEDIAYDSVSRRFFLTSVLEEQIVMLTPHGRLAQFARAPDRWPMLAVKIDAPRGVVWATEVALNGFRSVPKRDWGRCAVLAYDLRSGRLLQRIEGSRGSQLGDAALAQNGELLVSDSNGGALYRVRLGEPALKRIDASNFISPMTPAFAPAGQTYVADYVRGIAVMNATTRRVAWIAMANTYALAGVDGLYWHDGRLIAIQNGIAPERVMLFTLGRGGTTLASQLPIESGTTRLDPTHGVLVGDNFYYIANSGWNQLANDGSVRRGAQLTPAAIMRIQ